MNCKPGELAIVVDSIDGDPAFLGFVVTTVRLIDLGDGGPLAWLTEPLLVDEKDGFHILWLDTSLQPIRGPESDAQDESNASLPTTTKELA